MPTDLRSERQWLATMSLRRAVVAPYRQRGVELMTESEFVVALSLDRSWFSPDQAKRLVNVATAEGLLAQTDEGLAIGFDPDTVDIPDDFVPDEDILTQRTTFERVLDMLVEDGATKQEAVAAINRRQTDLGISLDSSAVLYARQQGLDVSDLADRALTELQS